MPELLRQSCASGQTHDVILQRLHHAYEQGNRPNAILQSVDALAICRSERRQRFLGQPFCTSGSGKVFKQIHGQESVTFVAAEPGSKP